MCEISSQHAHWIWSWPQESQLPTRIPSKSPRLTSPYQQLSDWQFPSTASSTNSEKSTACSARALSSASADIRAGSAYCGRSDMSRSMIRGIVLLVARSFAGSVTPFVAYKMPCPHPTSISFPTNSSIFPMPSFLLYCLHSITTSTGAPATDFRATASSWRIVPEMPPMTFSSWMTCAAGSSSSMVRTTSSSNCRHAGVDLSSMTDASSSVLKLVVSVKGGLLTCQSCQSVLGAREAIQRGLVLAGLEWIGLTLRVRSSPCRSWFCTCSSETAVAAIVSCTSRCWIRSRSARTSVRCSASMRFRASISLSRGGGPSTRRVHSSRTAEVRFIVARLTPASP